MSDARIEEATIEGLRGPYFDGLEPIQALYQTKVDRLNMVLMKGFQDRWSPVHPIEPWIGITSDGYEWPYVVPFEFYNRHFQIAFPAVSDSKKVDGSRADRHVALYYQGRQMSAKMLDRLMRRVATLFEDAYEEMYGHI